MNEFLYYLGFYSGEIGIVCTSIIIMAVLILMYYGDNYGDKISAKIIVIIILTVLLCFALKIFVEKKKDYLMSFKTEVIENEKTILMEIIK